METIIQKTRECHVCGRVTGLQRHHCIHGTANRRLAEKYGLWVWLCGDCHRAVHGRTGHELDIRLHQDAQKAFEAIQGGRDAFMAIFGKNWL